MEFSAVILTGGRSSRMGRDKAWLEFRKRPLILHQVQTALSCGAGNVYISCGEKDGYGALGWPTLKDNFPGLGPLAGLEAALSALEQEMLLVLAVDMPFITPAVLRNLARRCRPRCGVVPRVNGDVEPLAAFYPKQAHQCLLELICNGFRSARQFAQMCAGVGMLQTYDLPQGQSALFANWNRPADISTHSLPKVKAQRQPVT